VSIPKKGQEKSIETSSRISTAQVYKQKKREINRPPVFKMCKKYPEDILELERKINSTTNKKSYASVLSTGVCAGLTISRKNRSVKFANKPCVNGRINDKPVVLFMDSGAEVNVIDHAYLKTLDNSISERVKPSPSYNLKCANNSSLKLVGKVNIPITVGIKTKYLSFIVAEDLSSKVIVRIRGLKTLNVELHPGKDVIMCSGIEISFLGRTICESLRSKNVKQVL